MSHDMTNMTQQIWDKMSPAQRDLARDNSNLIPQLIGCEGYRCEIKFANGSTKRFIVGKTTGWKPAHLFMARSNQHGSSILGHDFGPVLAVRKLEKVR